MFGRLLRSRAAKVGVGFVISMVLVVMIGAAALPNAINTWTENGTVIHHGTDGSGEVETTLNTLWVTVGGIVLIAIVILAFIRNR